MRRAAPAIREWQSAVGIFLACIVLALSFVSASPEWHAWLHGHSDRAHRGGRVEQRVTHPGTDGSPSASHAGENDADDNCAVVLFAHGVVVAALLLFIARFFARVCATLVSLPQRPRFQSRRYLHPPLCGPPLVE